MDVLGFQQYLKEQGVISFKNYCTCGGYSRSGDHPHLAYCAQFKEYEEWWMEYEMMLIGK